jgi:hypothetical protein
MKYKDKRTVILVSGLEGLVILTISIIFLFIARNDISNTTAYIEDYVDGETDCFSTRTEYEYVHKCSLRCKVEVRIGVGMDHHYIMTTVGMPWDVDHSSLKEAIQVCGELYAGASYRCIRSMNKEQVILPIQLDYAKTYLKQSRKLWIGSIASAGVGFVIIIASTIALIVLLLHKCVSNRAKHDLGEPLLGLN